MKSRYERLLEVIDFLKREGVSSHTDPRIPALVERYLRAKYGFGKITIQDYIKTVRMMMRGV